MKRGKPVIYEYKRKSKGEIILHCCVSALFMIVALSYLYILFWTIMSSLKTHSEIVLNPFALPEKWQWDNYLKMGKLMVVNGSNFWQMLFNSVVFSVCPAFLSQFFLIWFGYTCAKYTFPGSKSIVMIIIFLMLIPLYGTTGGVYAQYHNLGLIDSYLCILTSIGSGVVSTTTLYYIAFFQNMSWSYAEAAMVDGANDFWIYFKVMLPQAKAMFGAFFLLQWMGLWADYENAMIFRPNLPTLPIGIYQFNVEMMYRARLDILFAACFVVSVPGIILFILFNKTLTTNLSLGGLKG